MIDTIIKSFDIWTDAQGLKSRGRVKSIENISLEGIVRLRELILELAIEGKLVKQDPTDQPVDQILQITKKEVNKLVKDGKLKKTKSLPEVDKREYPFSLPNGWQFVRLNEIGEWGSGATPNRSNSTYYGGNIPWFKSGELTDDYIDSSEEFITKAALDETSVRYNHIGDVLLAMYGATIGKTSILNVRGTTNQAVCACTPFPCIINTYLLILLKAYKSRFMGMGAGGAQPNISREKIINTVIGLPPAKEQKRIVAKVEELMALCNQLEAQQTNSLKTHQQLVKTLLETLTQAKDVDEVQTAWQQLLPHFDTLFCTEDSIEQLKQTILQLAIMGRLVKQDPKDEPAKELIKRIEKEKAKLIKEGKIKKEKPLPEISEKEKPFELPKGWLWCRLAEAGILKRGKSKHRPRNDKRLFDEGYYPFIQTGEVSQAKKNGGTITSINGYYNDFGLEQSEIQTAGTLCITIAANIAEYGFLSFDACVPDSIVCFNSIDPAISNYVGYFIHNSKEMLEKFAPSTAQKNINLGILSELKFPLPPIEEQKRIVARVNELMALCDQLKNKVLRSQQIQNTLSKTIVENAVA